MAKGARQYPEAGFRRLRSRQRRRPDEGRRAGVQDKDRHVCQPRERGGPQRRDEGPAYGADQDRRSGLDAEGAERGRVLRGASEIRLRAGRKLVPLSPTKTSSDTNLLGIESVLASG